MKLLQKAWKKLSWGTLAEMGIDLGLILIAMLLYAAYVVAASQILAPLAPWVGAAETNDSSILMTQAPEINMLMIQAGLLLLLFVVLFAGIYSAAKTYLWSRLHGTWSNKSWLLNWAFVGIVLMLTLLIPFFILIWSMLAAVIVFFILLALALLALPFYIARLQKKHFLGYLWWVFVLVLAWLVIAHIIGLLVLINVWLYLVVFIPVVLWYLAFGRRVIDEVRHG